jgi:cytochrome b subunit of formate dehydrogenase
VDRGEPTYQTYKTAEPLYKIVIPLVVLVIVVAIVSGLVLSGVVQGDQESAGPVAPITTESTLLIVP